ncbi:hypothetical protein ASF62_03220 [Leifsonia sp. Leaf325]|nr:flagellar hook-length control protein FliK [Leifsonia sp. Leaf325]KQQ95541.1 hypothetical protein ASF62_03220 [Leifsonia sp. Leaf325]
MIGLGVASDRPLVPVARHAARGDSSAAVDFDRALGLELDGSGGGPTGPTGSTGPTRSAAAATAAPAVASPASAASADEATAPAGDDSPTAESDATDAPPSVGPDGGLAAQQVSLPPLEATGATVTVPSAAGDLASTGGAGASGASTSVAESLPISAAVSVTVSASGESASGPAGDAASRPPAVAVPASGTASLSAASIAALDGLVSRPPTSGSGSAVTASASSSELPAPAEALPQDGAKPGSAPAASTPLASSQDDSQARQTTTSMPSSSATSAATTAAIEVTATRADGSSRSPDQNGPVPAPSGSASVAPASPVASGGVTVVQAPTDASAPSAAPPAARPVDPPLAPQLLRPLTALAQAGPGQHVLSIDIAPEALGPVTVRAHLGVDGLRIELFAPTDAGRDAIRGIIGDLRRDLATTGLGASLDLSSRDPRDSGAQQNAAREQGEGGEGRMPGDGADRGSSQQRRPVIVPASVQTTAPSGITTHSTIDVMA